MNSWTRRITSASQFLLLLVATISLASGQANIGGGLRGTITDQTGALIQNGTVVLTNKDTNVKRTTNIVAGTFTFEAVAPGSYSVKVDAAGFKQALLSDVAINLNEIRSANITLEVGATTDTVQVSEEATSIVTQQSSVVGLFTEEAIQNLPLNGRDYQNLLFLSPGVSRSAGGTGQGSGISAAGARPTNNNYLIDGGDANDPVVPFGTATNTGNSISAVPLDALGQFTVITSNASAEFGRSSGGVVNVVTKSGSNSLHFSAWEFLRNSVLNTRGFYDPQNVKSPFKSNQFGARAGGPIWKDRTFFSVAYEGYRRRASASTTIYVPTTQLIDTISNPALKGLLSSFYPSVSGNPNPASIGDGTATLSRNYTNNLDGDTGFARIDHNFSDKNKIFFTLSLIDYVSGAPNSGTLVGNGYGNVARPYHVVVDDTHFFNTHLFNDARFAYQRTPINYPSESNTAAQLASGSLRSTGPYAGQPYSGSVSNPNGIPTLLYNNSSFTSIGQPYNMPQGRTSNIFSYQNAISWEKGHHQIKAGFELRRLQENSFFSPYLRPYIVLNDSNLANLQTGAITSQTQYFFLTGSSQRGFRSLEQGYFVQDTWRFTPRLTFDLGLRYEIFLPFSEVHGLLNNAYVLDSNNQPKGCESLPYNSDLSKVAVLNPTKYGLQPFCSDLNNFAPRLGFSYDVSGNGKTVVNGAYGVFFDRVFSNIYGNTRFNAPQVANITSFPTTFNGFQDQGVISTSQVYNVVSVDPKIRTPYTQRFNLSVSQELKKNTSLTLAYVGSVGTKLLVTQRPNLGATFATSFRPTNQGVTTRSQSDIDAGIIRAPFGNFAHRTANGASNFHSLEATVRRRAAKSFVLQGTYTYARSRDNMSDEISGGTDSSFPPATFDNLLAPYLSPGSSCSAIPSSTLNGSTISSDAVLTSAVRCASGNASLTTAQAAQLFVNNYLKFRPIGANYGDSGFDVRHRFAASVLYTLPFAKNSTNLLGKAVNGWNVGSVLEAQSGTPYIIYTGYDANRDGDTNDRATLVSGKSLNPGLKKNFASSGPIVSRYQCAAFDSTAHTRTCSAGSDTVVFGQALGVIDPALRTTRGSSREPGIFNWDFQASKNTTIHERFNVRFNADLFNILNHTNINAFSSNGSTITSSTFGRASSQRSLGQTQSRQIQFGIRLEY